MADISEIVDTALKERLFNDITVVQNSPVLIQEAILGHLERITGSQVNVVDPTNPFIFLLESSSVSTSAAILENRVLLRKQYPVLSQHDLDLYRNLTDLDYVGRFGVPVKANMEFLIHQASFQTSGVSIPGGNQVTIPRFTVVMVGDLPFILLYPIDITRYASGGLKISYNTEIPHPLENVSSDILKHVEFTDTRGNGWIKFTVPMLQLDVQSLEYSITSTGTFSETISLDSGYYHARVFHKNNDTNNMWSELRTTHTDQVYDPSVATVLLTVVAGKVTVRVPGVYLTTNPLIKGVMRVDIYTTQGNITTDFRDLAVGSFRTHSRVVDPVEDSNVFTAASSGLTLNLFSTDRLDGGRDELSFLEFRQRVIDHTTGPINLPITEKQLEVKANNHNYALFKGIDTLTDRVYILTRDLPEPASQLVSIQADSTCMEVVADKISMLESPGVIEYNDSLVINSGTVFIEDNDIVTPMTSAMSASIAGMGVLDKVNAINAINSLYVPFYYVLDLESDRTDIRAYHLDNPEVHTVSFLALNPGVVPAVNTDAVLLTKTPTGYTLTVRTVSNDEFKSLPIAQTGLQISIDINGGTSILYKNSDSGVVVDGENVYTVDLVSNNHLDSMDNLLISNMSSVKGIEPTARIPLDCIIKVRYYTTSVSVPVSVTDLDDNFNTNLVTGTAKVLTGEEFHTTFGKSLKHLFAKGRVSYNENKYQTYPADILKYYPATVYQIDPDTGSVFSFDNDVDCNISSTILHNIGDPVLDVEGEHIVLHRQGDVVLDDQGNPIIDVDRGVVQHVLLYMIEGDYLYADTSEHKDYYTLMANVVSDRVTQDVPDINNSLLERSEALFSSSKTTGSVAIRDITNKQTTIRARQVPTITIYVSSTTSNDADVIKLVTTNASRVLNDVIKQRSVGVEQIQTIINDSLGNIVRAVKVSGVGAEQNIGLIVLVNDHERLALGKRLEVVNVTNIAVVADVNINVYFD